MYVCSQASYCVNSQGYKKKHVAIAAVATNSGVYMYLNTMASYLQVVPDGVREDHYTSLASLEILCCLQCYR